MSVEYLPVCTGVGNNADSQADFAGSGYQELGFVIGVALPQQANKCWRQSSMFAAAWANIIANTLGISVPDDGNLTNLIAWLQAISVQKYFVANATTGLFIPASALGLGQVIRINASGTAIGDGGGVGSGTLGMTIGKTSAFYQLLGSPLPTNSGANTMLAMDTFLILNNTGATSQCLGMTNYNLGGTLTSVLLDVSVDTTNPIEVIASAATTGVGVATWGPLRVTVA
jgi:hypothetical protein